MNVSTVFVICTFLANCYCSKPGPRYPPTQGEVWPKPWQQKKSTIAYKVNPTKLEFKITNKNCQKIQQAIQRCKDYIITLSKLTKPEEIRNADLIEEIEIGLSQDCEEYPQFGMDESYNLIVNTKSELKSNSVWGIIRGMETFSQLFYIASDFKNVAINRTQIVDNPNYKHRGLLIDTGRHYLSVKNILKTLDAMAMNKMNVLHWHIVDDESFPYQSTKFPELSDKGAFHASMIYSKGDLKMIRDHARDLGVRILIEIDMPGHAWSWGVSHPEIITQADYQSPYSPPMNPIKNETYMLVSEVMKEIQKLFPDKFFHLGGDEVEYEYWYRNPEINKYMEDHNIIDINDILAMFFEKIIRFLRRGTAPVVWEEVFNDNVPLPKTAIIQTWRGADSMVKVLDEGYRGIQSAPYYLDRLNTQFVDYYKEEPRLSVAKKVKNGTLLRNLVGGEACMWCEMVDDTNLLSRVWPRASAVAEVLWSQTFGEKPDEEVYSRIEEHTCRMRRRGIPAEPAVGPGYCIV